jgi:kynurenine formamidase
MGMAGRYSSGMPVIDVSGTIRDGMWHYGEPYLDMPVPPVRVREVEFPEKYRGSIFTQVVEMCVQTGTYLETAAHVDAARETIADIPLERTWMVPTVVIHTPSEPGHKVTLNEVRRSLDDQGVSPASGDALLIHTGRDRAWDEPDRYLSEMPYMSREVMDWVIEQEPGIFGCDTPRADSPNDPQGFFGDFFATQILLLAPLVNLGAVTQSSPKPRLCVLPLRIERACASPVRAAIVTD